MSEPGDGSSGEHPGEAPRRPEPPRTTPLEPGVPSRPYGPRPAGWTGTSPTALPGGWGTRPAAPPTPPTRPAPTGGVPSRPEPLPAPRPTAAPRVAPSTGVLPGRSPDSRATAATTVVPGGRGAAAPRAPLTPTARPVRGRRARLALRRLDPWSVFVMSLLLSLFLAVVTIVAAFVLYAVLDGLGVPASINKSVTDVNGAADVLTRGRFLGGAALLAALNVVLLTALATLGSLLYNLCATFTGGLELTLAERD